MKQGAIEVKINKTTIVPPAAQETAEHTIWMSNIDLIARNTHTKNVYFYRRPPKSNGHNINNSCSSVEPAVESLFNPPDMLRLRDALSRALVPFYPLAGRFKKDENGRTEIDCNGKGVLFVEAETTSSIDDLGDFAPTLEVRKLVPTVDYSEGISSYPLAILQVTRFSCGGVSIGVGIHHAVGDGFAGLHFINTWSEMCRRARARGFNSQMMMVVKPPFFDRTILRAREPPKPEFEHTEYQPSPPLLIKNDVNGNNNNNNNVDPIFSIFKLTKEQVNTIKYKSNSNTTTFEILAAHIWQSVCKARELQHEQDTKLYMMVNGRFRLQPRLPPDYFGNVVFQASLIFQSGDLISMPANVVANKIHDVLERTDDVYMRSAIDYLENKIKYYYSQPADFDAAQLVRGAHTYKCPNLLINTWTRLPIHDADFGWGKPIFMGPLVAHEGMAYLLPSPTPLHDIDGGATSLVISLQPQAMKLFPKYFYDI